MARCLLRGGRAGAPSARETLGDERNRALVGLRLRGKEGLMMIRDGLIAAVLATGTTLTLPARAEEAGRAEAAATPPSAAFAN